MRCFARFRVPQQLGEFTFFVLVKQIAHGDSVELVDNLAANLTAELLYLLALACQEVIDMLPA
jgi:hypothetical protein